MRKGDDAAALHNQSKSRSAFETIRQQSNTSGKPPSWIPELCSQPRVNSKTKSQCYQQTGDRLVPTRISIRLECKLDKLNVIFFDGLTNGAKFSVKDTISSVADRQELAVLTTKVVEWPDKLKSCFPDATKDKGLMLGWTDSAKLLFRIGTQECACIIERV